MSYLRKSATPGLALAVAVTICPVIQGQAVDSGRLAAVQARLAQVTHVLSNLPDKQQQQLSSGAQNLLQLAHGLNEVEGLSNAPQIQAQIKSIRGGALRPFFGFPVLVNNPATDFLFSIEAGFTQSETSTAWCGSSVVVGYNDSTSEFETLLFGPGGVSFSGASFSTDGGQTFRDVGPINPGPNPMSFLAGDPVVNCADAHTTYFSQIFQTGSITPFVLQTGVAVSKSADGGATWANPVAAVLKDGTTHFIDKPWSALDPSHATHLFVTYTDFDFSGAVCGMIAPGVPVTRYAIESVRSTDGGATWSGPVVIDQICSTPPDFPFLSGPQVLVTQQGSVFVAWEAFTTGTTRELRIAKSANAGASFQRFVKVTDVTPTGDGSLLQAGIRNNEFPSLAVNRSTGPSNGVLYIGWNDGRLLQYPDFEAPSGTYGYASVFVTRSSDGGSTWSAPVRVNDDPVASVTGRGTDHFQPGVAVDKTGAVAACWYDRRNDPLNLTIARFCATSRDSGATWTNQAVPLGNWSPFHAGDAFVNPYYLGDYDALTSDLTAASPGFMGAFGNVELPRGAFVPNQDVFLVHF